MKILLTEFQKKQLAPLLQTLHEAADAGRPGMTVAQLYIGTGEMVCGFVNHEYAAKIQRVAEDFDPLKRKLVGGMTLSADDRQTNVPLHRTEEAKGE